jgi:hypothetical protein
MNKLDKHVWVEEAGRFISENTRRLAEVINDYDSSLFLAPIPDQLRDDCPEYAYALICEGPNGQRQLAFRFKEAELLNPAEILARIITNDTQRFDVLSRLETMDRAQKLLETKEELEIAEANKDFAATILKSPLHTFKHNGRTYT